MINLHGSMTPSDNTNPDSLNKNNISENICNQEQARVNELVNKLVEEYTEPEIIYVDANKLLKGKVNSKKINEFELDYYIRQACISSIQSKIMLKANKNGESDSIKILNKLSLLMLHLGFKAAFNETAPSTPFAEFRIASYHRLAENRIIFEVEVKIAENFGVNPRNILILEDDLEYNFSDVLSRNCREKKVINSQEELQTLLETPLNPIPDMLDVTKLNLTPKKLEHVNRNLHAIYGRNKPNLVSFFNDNDMIFLYASDPHAVKKIRTDTGFMLTSENAYKTWLKLASSEEIFSKANVAQVRIATSSQKIPIIYPSFKEFIAGEEMLFEKLVGISGVCLLSPEQKILAEGLISMLKGLCNLNKDVSELFENSIPELTDILQYSYFRINNAFKEALLYRDDLLKFQKALDVVSQEIQMILSIAEPYGPKDLEQFVVNRLQSEDGFIKGKDCRVSVYAQPSGMRCLSTVISSIQSQIDLKPIQTLILKDSYYESVGSLQGDKMINSSFVDGDSFNDDPVNTIRELKDGIELFLCEFHHNISVYRNNYTLENITEQIKEIFKQGKAAQQLNVVIDTTINHELSEDFKRLFMDPDIQSYIENGRLNISLIRSAQKFDMLGFDNYYGGIATVINNGRDFVEFNNRISRSGEQLKGGDYQGLCHLQAYASKQIEAYQKAIMKNTRALYDMLPQSVMAKNGGVVQVSEIQDDKVVFIDIKFDAEFRYISRIFKSNLYKYSKANKAPLTSRASFGFPNSNLIDIHTSDGTLHRLSVGLENYNTLKIYAAFFEEFQSVIDKVFLENEIAISGLNNNKMVLKDKKSVLLNLAEEIIGNYIIDIYSMKITNLKKALEDNFTRDTLKTLYEAFLIGLKAKTPLLDNFKKLKVEITNLIAENEKFSQSLEDTFKSHFDSHLFTNHSLSVEENEVFEKCKNENESLIAKFNNLKINGAIKFPLTFDLTFGDQFVDTYVEIGIHEAENNDLLRQIQVLFNTLSAHELGRSLVPEDQINKYKNFCAIKIADKKYFIDMDSLESKGILNFFTQCIDIFNSMLTPESFSKLREKVLAEVTLKMDEWLKQFEETSDTSGKEEFQKWRSIKKNLEKAAPSEWHLENTNFFWEAFTDKLAG